DLGKPDSLGGIILGHFLEHRPELLARPAPFGPEVEDDQRGHRGLNDLLLKALDRVAFGFGQAKSCHGLNLPLQLVEWPPIWAASATVTSACGTGARHARRAPHLRRWLEFRPRRQLKSGRSSGVEHNLAKVGVEGSNPFARSSCRQPPLTV